MTPDLDRTMNGISRVFGRGAWLGVLAGVLLVTPAQAQTAPEIISPFDAALIESLIAPRALIGEVVTERDLDLLLAHIKASILATGAGGEPPPPSDELKQRAEAIGKALRTRGTFAALVLLDALEASTRQRLREMQRQRAVPAAAARAPGSI